jgi:hypothetical protein
MSSNNDGPRIVAPPGRTVATITIKVFENGIGINIDGPSNPVAVAITLAQTIKGQLLTLHVPESARASSKTLHDCSVKLADVLAESLSLLAIDAMPPQMPRPGVVVPS